MEIPVSEIHEYLLPSNNPDLKEIGIDTTFDECTCLDCSDALIVSLPCGHKYHKNCITPWIERTHDTGPTCPICRRTMINNYEFWFKFGREMCNIKTWCDYCETILYNNFGLSSKYTKLFNAAQRFDGIQSNLDYLLQQSYDLDEDSTFNEKLKQYLQTTKQVYLIDVFYTIGNIKEPDYIYSSNKVFPKTLTREQQEYIYKFKSRVYEFLKYLEFILENMPNPKNAEEWRGYMGGDARKRLEINTTKLKKWYEKLSVLDEINLS